MTDVLKCMRKFKKLILVCLFLVLPVLYLNSADIVYAVNMNLEDEIIKTNSETKEKVYDSETAYYVDITATINVRKSGETGEIYYTYIISKDYYLYDGFEYTYLFNITDDEKLYDETEIEPTQAPNPTPVVMPTIAPQPTAVPIPTSAPYYMDNPFANGPLQNVITNDIVSTNRDYSDYNYDYSLNPGRSYVILNKPVITVDRKKSTSAVIKWKKISKADGYYVFRSTKEDSGYKKIKTIKNKKTVSYTNKGLSTGKNYYYKVQAYCVNNGKEITSISEPVQVTTMKTRQVYKKLMQLKKKFPNGKYWNHVGRKMKEGKDTSNYVTSKPCNHSGSLNQYGVKSTCNMHIDKANHIRGYQCYGFASLLSDKIFGNKVNKTHRSFSKARVGDHVRYSAGSSGGHSVIIVEKHKNYIIAAECNYGNTCRIVWGRKISAAELRGAMYLSKY